MLPAPGQGLGSCHPPKSSVLSLLHSMPTGWVVCLLPAKPLCPHTVTMWLSGAGATQRDHGHSRGARQQPGGVMAEINQLSHASHPDSQEGTCRKSHLMGQLQGTALSLAFWTSLAFPFTSPSQFPFANSQSFCIPIFPSTERLSEHPTDSADASCSATPPPAESSFSKAL